MNLGDFTEVPIQWMASLVILMLTGIWLWLKHEFRRNESQHKEAQSGLKGVHQRIDHLILHLLPSKPYKEPDDDT